MSTWSKTDRFEAVLSNQLPDRTPVAAWGHFIPEELLPSALVQATADFTETYDWDWIKLNPRATFYGEIWDTRYDHSNIDVFQPSVISALITEPEHIWRVHRETGIRSKTIADGVLSTELLAKALPEVPIAQTVFSPLTALLEIAGQPVDLRDHIEGSPSRATLTRLLTEQPEGVRYALDEISATFLNYFERLKAAGASALFYAITTAPNNPALDAELVDRFSTDWDRDLIGVAQDLGLKVILHTCGDDVHPERVASLGANALSWDQASPLNPNIDEIPGIVPVGGVDRIAVNSQDVEAVAAQAAHTEQLLAGKPHLLTPTCAVETSFDNPALTALRATVPALAASA